MKRTLFVNLGQFVQSNAQLHVWLHVSEKQTALSPEVLSQASAEVYNAMIHNQQIRKNDHVLVFAHEAGVVHSTLISHIDFPGLKIQNADLIVIWQRMKDAVRLPPFQLMRMDFKEDGKSVYCCQTIYMNDQIVSLMISTCLSLKVNTTSPIVCYLSQKKITYLE